MNKEKARIIKLIKSFPLGQDFVLKEGWWKVGYLALDEVAEYLINEDRYNAAKRKMKRMNKK